MEESPLLTGIKSDTQLDLITENLFFVFPLSEPNIKFLNTIIYKDDYFWINYWSFTHTLFAIVWAILGIKLPKIFNIINYLIFHSIFELWELWAGGYFTGERKIDTREIIDGLMDTLFGLAGIYMVHKFKEKNMINYNK